MKNRKISIITPVWNRIDLTIRFLYQNWVLYSDYQNIEWVIIDNGSSDDTAQVLEGLRNMMGERLKVISLKENTGFGPGNNRGAEIATGDVLAFISNDVQMTGDYITPVEAMMSRDPGPALFGPEIFSHNTGWNTFDVGTIPYVAGWCVIVEKKYWESLCRWDERFVPCDYEDIDLSYQVLRSQGELRELHLPLKHDSGKSAQSLPGGRLAVTLANQKRFCKKWGLTIGTSF